jgi:HKD family nuclease
MGIRDLSIFELDDETILKIYTAVKTAGEYELIVLDDFLRKESKKFESFFRELLLDLVKSGIKIIYLSTESFDITENLDDTIEIDKFLCIPIDLKEVTLR